MGKTTNSSAASLASRVKTVSPSRSDCNETDSDVEAGGADCDCYACEQQVVGKSKKYGKGSKGRIVCKPCCDKIRSHDGALKCNSDALVASKKEMIANPAPWRVRVAKVGGLVGSITRLDALRQVKSWGKDIPLLFLWLVYRGAWGEGKGRTPHASYTPPLFVI